jgi:elongin-A
MAPQTLVQQCQDFAMRNLTRFDDDALGETPWRLLEPILNKCEDSKQLHRWEVNHEQIRGLTGDIWLKFIKRDIPNWRNKPYEPANPESWWKVYKKLKGEADDQERKANEFLKNKMSKIKRDEDEWKVAPPTRAIPEKTGRNKGTAMQFQRGSDNNGLRFTTGTKTKDFFKGVKRQAAEHRLQSNGVLARQTHMLNNGVAAKKIMQAPQHMVEDRQRQADLARPSAPRPSEALKPAAAGTSPQVSLAARTAHDLKMREERLRAVREGRAVPSPTPAASPAQPASPAPARAGPVGKKLVAPAIPKTTFVTLRPITNASKTMPTSTKPLPTASQSRSKTLAVSNRDMKKASSVSRPHLAPAPTHRHSDPSDDLFDESIPLPSVERYIPEGKEDNPHCNPNYRTWPKKPKSTPTPPKPQTPTILVERKKTPPKIPSQSNNMREVTPSRARTRPSSTAGSGAKRKKGPTILLPMKRTKR